MKTFKIKLFVALGSALGSILPLIAQQQVIIENQVPNSLVVVSMDDIGNEIVEVMQTSQLPHVHDPQIPRFILTDREGNFALGIGGYVRTVTSYDFDGLVDNVDFIPAYIPNQSPVNNQIQMDATTANIFLKLVGNSSLLGNFIIYTEGNFRGVGNTFKLRNAYMSFGGLTIGYTYGGFMDASAMPATIDFQGPNGATFYRTTQLSYLYIGMQNFKVNFSVEMPQVNGSTGEHLLVTRQYKPNFTLHTQYDWAENSHLRIAGIIRSMTYTNAVTSENDDILGYGVQASTTFDVGSVNLFGQFTYGKGIGEFFNDLGELNVDLVEDPNNDNKLQALPMMGWYAGVQYNISSNLFVSGTYSMSRLFSENGYDAIASSNYHYGQYAVANIFWKTTDNLQLGAEYLHGWRTNFDHSNKQANRINLSAKFSF
jgi:hypothetical protein